jgi:hypothetical protein
MVTTRRGTTTAAAASGERGGSATVSTSRGARRKRVATAEDGPAANDGAAPADASKRRRSRSRSPQPPPVQVLERGRIAFYYRPKVDPTSTVATADDVQRLYLVLRPDSAGAGAPATRVLSVGKKRLPAAAGVPGPKETLWAFVRMVRAGSKRSWPHPQAGAHATDAGDRGRRVGAARAGG